MDENRLPELPQEAFRPMIAQSVQLEQFLGEELTFCFRDLDGAHTFTTCYGDIYKTVNALRDYVRLLESVCDQWELTGFHRATNEYHAEKLRKIADKLQAGIGYDYDKAVEKCKKNLDTLTRFCRGYAQPTSEPTEFNLYSETAHFYIWLRLITRRRDYNVYVHYYLKG